MRCSSPETHVFNSEEFEKLDKVVAEEFLSALVLVTDSSLTFERILGEKEVHSAFLCGSSFCAGFLGSGLKDWSLGLLSPEEMTVNMAKLVMEGHAEGLS